MNSDFSSQIENFVTKIAIYFLPNVHFNRQTAVHIDSYVSY